MSFRYSPFFILRYLLKRESDQFFLSVAIRSLALGMVVIFEPIYLYFYFDKSLSLTLLFFAAIYGLYGVLVHFGGKIMSKIGFDLAMLASHFFFFGYYLILIFIQSFASFVLLAIFLKTIGMILFWPSFHTDFTRFSRDGYRGREVGKKNVATLIPTILSPVIGGWILASFGYPSLFIAVLAVLLASAIPLFFNKEKYEVYTDSYKESWQRIFKKGNRKSSLAFTCNSIELGVNGFIWPLFMAILAIGYLSMGWITSFAIFVSSVFVLYLGRLSDTGRRSKLLNIGSFLTSISWIVKYFVITPFSAFLAHTFYRICRASANVPFQTFFYEKAFLKKELADEFIISREITDGIAKCFSLIFFAILFLIIPKVNLAFLFAAIISFGFTFLGRPPEQFVSTLQKVKNIFRFNDNA